jgi:uncharacterized protein
MPINRLNLEGMKESEAIRKTEDFISSHFKNEGSGHDWFHVNRVRKMAISIGSSEGCDLFVVEMAALLHDLDDWKLNGHKTNEVSKTENWLNQLSIDPKISSFILRIIAEVSYKGAGTETPVSSVEASVVQDADRLDAIGAIGIARTFAYGGHKSRLIYDPSVPPLMHADFGEYQNSSAPTINHFYEKLLLLKDRMNTETAKKIAKSRHDFMEKYLSQFYDEWEAKK